MRILQINKFFYRRGGADIHMLDLCRLLENHGHEIIHFSTLHPANEPSPFSRFFIPQIDMRAPRGLLESLKTFVHILYSTEAAKKLEQLIRETKPDIAHLHNIYHHLSPSLLPVLKKHKIPVVLTLHDYKLICPNYKLFTQGAICERCRGHKFFEAVKHRCIFNQKMPSLAAALESYLHHWWGIYQKNIDIFISPSQFLKNKFTEFGWSKEKIEVLPNFLPPQKIPPALEQKDSGYLLYFGRLSEEKGLMVLLKAMEILSEIPLRLVGGGPLANQIFNTILLKQLNNVKMAGYKTGEDLEKEIAGARLVVLPSAWYENCPVSLLEAMARGKTVLASRLGGILEIVQDGVTGLLFQPGDSLDLAEKIKTLWTDSPKIQALGEAAKKQVETENDEEKYYQKLMEIYQKISQRTVP
ncbi:MAG: glycosyltransferase family 4 protein [Candidatus Magasanikbacteria bacterium]|nr:glycosyltransferase family 4 protein [Candidatus Magasanikbacteria bacterium]